MAKCLVALGTDEHIFAVETIFVFALIARQPIVLAFKAGFHAVRSTVEEILAFVAEFLLALGTLYSTLALVAFWLITNMAIAEMIPLGKVVTLSAANPPNLGHFAVCAFLLGASRHPDLSKSRTMSFTKASMQATDLGKLPHCHESRNGSSVQKSEHAVAHEILRKYLGEKHGRRRILFLRLRSCHDDDDWFPEQSQRSFLSGDEIRWKLKSRGERVTKLWNAVQRSCSYCAIRQCLQQDRHWQ
jgi:hypothetical protein